MFEILIIDRNKNKNHNWDYQSIIHHPFYMESTWNPLISRPLRVPPQQISSISADGETLGRIRPRYSSCWFVTRMTSNKPHIYIYTTCIYMYACMHACMDGWMDGWAGLLGVITVHNKHSYESTSFFRGSAINPALLWATARRGPPTACRFV